MTYIDDKGRRVTTESSYLTPEVLSRPNLKVAVYAHVTRILFDTTGDVKKAVGVEFSHNTGGPRYRVRVKKEVVLACVGFSLCLCPRDILNFFCCCRAGAIHSPHILLLSGVGPEEDLAEHGIPLVHNLPGVGRNLQDHPVVNARFSLKPGHSIQYITATKGLNLFRALGALVRWNLTGSGPLCTNVRRKDMISYCFSLEAF